MKKRLNDQFSSFNWLFTGPCTFTTDDKLLYAMYKQFSWTKGLLFWHIRFNFCGSTCIIVNCSALFTGLFLRGYFFPFSTSEIWRDTVLFCSDIYIKKKNLFSLKISHWLQGQTGNNKTYIQMDTAINGGHKITFKFGQNMVT